MFQCKQNSSNRNNYSYFPKKETNLYFGNTKKNFSRRCMRTGVHNMFDNSCLDYRPISSIANRCILVMSNYWNSQSTEDALLSKKEPTREMF